MRQPRPRLAAADAHATADPLRLPPDPAALAPAASAEHAQLAREPHPGGSTSPTAGHTRQAPPPSSSTPAPGTQLASTGGGSDAGMLAAAGLALMGGGALLYRRARTAGRHH
ncbi:LPXTG cell wall anchor domain-containing protein [Streptacidiphilus monticola]